MNCSPPVPLLGRAGPCNPMLTSYVKLLSRILLGTVVVFGVIIGIGYSLDQKHNATRETKLAAAPEVVWNTITDFSNAASFRPDLSRVDVLPAQNGMPVWREIDRKGEAITFGVIESKPPSRLVVKIAQQDLPFGGTWVYELKPTGAGTSVKITENGEIYHPIYRFVSHFFLNQAATIEEYLRSLERKHGRAA